MKKVCIGINPYGGFNGGTKARKDAVSIVCNMLGYELLPLSCPGEKLRIINFHPFLELFNFHRLNCLKDSIVFIQHPFPLAVMDFCIKSIVRNNKTILLSHDLDFLRDGRPPKKSEIDMFNSVSCIIAHNRKYKEYLMEIGVTTPIIELGIFDYLIEKPKNIPEHNFTRTISFVGNLDKSEFLKVFKNSNRTFDIELIGPTNEFHIKSDISSSCFYGGVFPPDEVPFHITGSFGLIWDGDSIDSCSGNLGHYMKYNNPHKFSLYVSSGIPVITWEKSALSDFVKENGIGFTINNLAEINYIFDNISSDSYGKMLSNVQVIQNRVVHGQYLYEALQKAEHILKTE